VDSGTIASAGKLTDFIEAVVEQGKSVGDETDKEIYTLLQGKKFPEWNEACKSFTATELPVGAALSKDAQFGGFINGYQGKYQIPDLKDQKEKARLIKDASRVASEQLLRRYFTVDGKLQYNPFGGFFLAKIQDVPYVIKFWLVLRNIVEAIPLIQAGEDLTINYFAQLFVLKAKTGEKTEEGKTVSIFEGENLFTCLQAVMNEIYKIEKFQVEAMDVEQKMRKVDQVKVKEALEEVVVGNEDFAFSFDDFGPAHLAWGSDKAPKMKLKEVKMSAEMKGKIVDETLNGESKLLDEWMKKVKTLGDFKSVILEGSDNCAGVHPGVIFTDETKVNDKLPWKDHLAKYTQAQVEDAHAEVVEKIQGAFPGKVVCIQGGFGVLEKEVDEALATVCKQLGQTNVGPTLGSGAWLSWAKGDKRSQEMGPSPDFGATRSSLGPKVVPEAEQKSIAPLAPANQNTNRDMGEVVQCSPNGKFFFIQPRHGRDRMFCHITNIAAGQPTLQLGDLVSYRTGFLERKQMVGTSHGMSYEVRDVRLVPRITGTAPAPGSRGANRDNGQQITAPSAPGSRGTNGDTGQQMQAAPAPGSRGANRGTDQPMQAPPAPGSRGTNRDTDQPMQAPPAPGSRGTYRDIAMQAPPAPGSRGANRDNGQQITAPSVPGSRGTNGDTAQQMQAAPAPGSRGANHGTDQPMQAPPAAGSRGTNRDNGQPMQPAAAPELQGTTSVSPAPAAAAPSVPDIDIQFLQTVAAVCNSLINRAAEGRVPDECQPLLQALNQLEPSLFRAEKGLDGRVCE
jgi:cold shock CspA family protein